MKTTRVMCSGGIGVLLGLAVANCIGLAFIGMIIGCLVGGVAGVCILCWKEICQNAPYVWRKVGGFITLKDIKDRVVMTLAVISGVVVSVEFLLAGLEISSKLFGGNPEVNPLKFILFASVVVFMFVLLVAVLLLFSILIDPKDGFIGEFSSMGVHPKVFLTWKWNPVSAPFVASFYAGKELVWFFRVTPQHFPQLLSKIWKALKIVGSFLFKMYKLIHSDATVCLFVDICIGVCASWCLGWHTPIQYVCAGLLGAVIAGINYRIVAIRWLKVQPTEA